MMPGEHVPAGYTKAEVDRWAHERREHEREPVPETGERLLFRDAEFAPPVPAIVTGVQDMTGPPHNHWHRNGGLEDKRGPGMPDVNVWEPTEDGRGWMLKADPWPWVHLRVIRQDADGSDLRDDNGDLVLDAPRWCREARVRGSCGWLREGSRAHTGRYEE
jgi:hypothetical protein